MDTLSYKTISANAATADKKWLLIDANNEVLGRLASKVAYLLRGKHKTNFTPHADCGDYVIIINAEKVRLTGKKRTDKVYLTHTGYPGGQKKTSPEDLFAKRPESVIEGAVKGMLPRNRLGRAIMGNLHVYSGETHKHEAQQPKEINLTDIKE